MVQVPFCNCKSIVFKTLQENDRVSDVTIRVSAGLLEIACNEMIRPQRAKRHKVVL